MDELRPETYGGRKIFFDKQRDSVRARFADDKGFWNATYAPTKKEAFAQIKLLIDFQNAKQVTQGDSVTVLRGVHKGRDGVVVEVDTHIDAYMVLLSNGDMEAFPSSDLRRGKRKD